MELARTCFDLCFRSFIFVFSDCAFLTFHGVYGRRSCAACSPARQVQPLSLLLCVFFQYQVPVFNCIQFPLCMVAVLCACVLCVFSLRLVFLETKSVRHQTCQTFGLRPVKFLIRADIPEID